MAELIVTNPRLAVREAVTLAQWHALPPSIQQDVEEPFSETGAYTVLPNCGKLRDASNLSFRDSTGRKDAYVYGRRKSVTTKEAAPVQGIRLGDDAALREDVFQPIQGSDVEVAARLYPVANPDPQHCFATGQELPEEPVTALAGGKQFLFADAATLREFEARVARLDHRLTPKGSSAVIHDLAAYFTDPADGFLLETAEATVAELEESWTLADKSILYVRVSFSDETEATPSKSTILANAGGAVNDSISNYSYGQVGITATVLEGANGSTFELSKTSAYYENGAADDEKFDDIVDELYADALAASGANTNAYDVVAIVMPPLELGFAGLATVGGQKQWLVSSSENVMLHELGHNYGLRHASRWDANVGEGSVGPGAKEEYGDYVDNMSRGDYTTGYWNQFHKSRLGWLDTAGWQNATTGGSGTYRIYQHDKPDATGIQGVRVDKGTTGGHNEYYWIGYRDLTRGDLEQTYFAEILWKQQDDDRSYLIDPQVDHVYPANDDFYEPEELGFRGLPMGFTHEDPDAQVYITPVGIGENSTGRYIDVVVNSGTGGAGGSIDVTLNGPTNNVTARSPAAFAASTTYGGTTAYGWSEGDDFSSGYLDTQTVTWLTGGKKEISVTASDLWGADDKDTIASVTVEDPLQTWHTRSSGTAYNLWGIAAGEVSSGTYSGSEVAIVVGRFTSSPDFDDTILRSTDGVTWTAFDLPEPNVDLFSAGYGDGLFVIAGVIYEFGDVNAWVPVIYTSSDGINWTQRHKDTDVNGFSPIYGVAHGPLGWVAVGLEGNVFTSSDGTTWSALSPGALGLPNATSLEALDFRGTGATDTHHWISASDGSNPGRTWKSSNLTSWQEVTNDTPLDGNDYFDNSSFDGNTLFLGGLNARFRTANSDLTSFDEPSTINLVDSDLSTGSLRINAVVISNGTYLAIGEDFNVGESSDDVPLDLVSVNGRYWHLLNRFGAGSIPDRNAAAVLNNTVITVGDDGSIRQSDPFYEPGGIWATWQQQFAVFLNNAPTSTSNQDGDSDPDLVEYALGNLPNDPSSSGGISLSIEGENTSTAVEPGVSAATEEEYPTLTVTRDEVRPDITYAVTQATILDDGDVNTAEFSTTNTEVVEDTDTTLKVRSTTPISADPDQYLRLEVELND